MPDIATVWNDFLSKILSETFSEFLNESELDERRAWIMTNITNINPDFLYKNLVYMLSNNSISKIAVGYKLHFLLDDWKTLFNNPYSEEFDRNPNLSEEDKLLLDRTIDQFGSVINHHMELLIHDSKYSYEGSITNLIKVVENLKTFYQLPNYNIMETMYVESNNLIYKLNIGQLLYFTAFNQNPIDGSPCDEIVIENIKYNYQKRFQMMETLKLKWPNGIPLKYVQSTQIF